MTHYQKLATMIFKIIGVFSFVLASISTIIALFFVAFGVVGVLLGGNGSGLEIGVPIILLYSLPTAVLSSVFVKFAPKFAAVVCNGFNE